MKFSCLQENLSRGLSFVSKAVSVKAPLPILENVLITASKGELELSATDLRIGIKTKIGAKVEKEGALAVPARVFTDLVNTLPKVTLDIGEEAKVLEIKTPQNLSKINALSPNEFPKFSQVPDKPLNEIDPKVFAEIVGKTAFAAATDDGRPILTGVLLKLNGKDGVMVGVDGFRLAEYKFSLQNKVDSSWQAAIPAKVANELARLFASSSEPLKIYDLKDSGEVGFESEKTVVFVKTLEGEFPDYEKIIPQQSKTEVLIPLEEFLQGLRTASVFAAIDSGGVINLKVMSEEKLISLSALASQVGENETSVDAEIEGEDLKIAFNSKYLGDFLSAVKGEKLTFGFSDSLSPARLTIKELPQYLYIIMPVRVQA